MAIFFNEEIFDSGTDFEIGGFETEQTELFTYANIYSGFRQRVEKLIEEYLDRAKIAYAQQEYDDPEQEAYDALKMVLLDNLGIELEYVSVETALEAIINSDNALKWLYDINEKISNFQLAYNNPKGIMIQMPTSEDSKLLYEEAQEIIENSSLEKLIEALSTIEL
jgi:hypothetical protein